MERFPSGRSNRWRDITKMVPGKNAKECRRRARFIKVHLYPGEEGEDKPEGAARTAAPELDLDNSSESVVVSDAEDDSLVDPDLAGLHVLRSVRHDPGGTGVDIRREAAYPGERTGAWVEAGEVIDITRESTIAYAHSDGHTYGIKFYLLADGRGWVHDFDPKEPGSRTFSLVCSTDSHTKADHDEGAPIDPEGEDKPEGAARTAAPELDLDNSSASVVVSGAEDDSLVDPDLAGLFDFMGMRNYASLARWLSDRNDLKGLRIVAREGLDDDADDSPESFLKLGIILHEGGNLPTAERAFRMAIQGRPANPEPYLYFGKMLEDSGHVLEAEKEYRRAIRLVADFADKYAEHWGAEDTREELGAKFPNLRNLIATKRNI